MPDTPSQRGGDRRKGKRYKPNILAYTGTCEWCGERFATSRPETRFCCASHRALASKSSIAQDRLLKEIADAEQRQPPKKRTAPAPVQRLPPVRRRPDSPQE